MGFGRSTLIGYMIAGRSTRFGYMIAGFGRSAGLRLMAGTG